jgi:hypothetical protein
MLSGVPRSLAAKRVMRSNAGSLGESRIAYLRSAAIRAVSFSANLACIFVPLFSLVEQRRLAARFPIADAGSLSTPAHATTETLY